MRTARGRELILQYAHRAQTGAQFCRPKMVLMSSQVRKMSTALRRDHHSQHKFAPRAGESAAARPRRAGRGRRRQKKYCIFSFETHRALTGEPGGGPSHVNSTRIAPARGVARRATAGGLMAAARGRAQRNEFNLHLDSAGHRFGAKAQGGMRQRSLRVGEKCGKAARR